jgi:hypothetical protein
MANRPLTPEPSPKRKAVQGTGYTKPSAKMPAPRQGAVGDGRTRLSPEERRRLIAETAYFIAERRGFSAGSELEDWLQAEAEVNRRLGGASPD